MADNYFKNEVAVITPQDMEKAFEGEFRQYIQGNLANPQKLKYIWSDECEIGISYYEEYTHDDPHYHDIITETNYIISGKVILRILDTNEEYLVEAGGVFSVPPKIKHVLKIAPKTKIIFTKSECVNDKHPVPFEDLGLDEWFEESDF